MCCEAKNARNCRKYVPRSTESARTPLRLPVVVRGFVSGGGGGGGLNRAGETISRYSILTFLYLLGVGIRFVYPSSSLTQMVLEGIYSLSGCSSKSRKMCAESS